MDTWYFYLAQILPKVTLSYQISKEFIPDIVIIGENKEERNLYYVNLVLRLSSTLFIMYVSSLVEGMLKEQSNV